MCRLTVSISDHGHCRETNFKPLLLAQLCSWLDLLQRREKSICIPYMKSLARVSKPWREMGGKWIKKSCNKGFARLMVKAGWKPRLLVHQRPLLNVNKNKNIFLSKWDGNWYFSKFPKLVLTPWSNTSFSLCCWRHFKQCVGFFLTKHFFFWKHHTGLTYSNAVWRTTTDERRMDLHHSWKMKWGFHCPYLTRGWMPTSPTPPGIS